MSLKLIKEFSSISFLADVEQPDIRPVAHPKIKPLYQANDDVVISWLGCVKGKTKLYTLKTKRGLYLDGQSAPKFAWSFGFIPDGACRLAVFIHDALYRTKGTLINPIPKGLNKGMVVKLTSEGEAVTLGQKAVDQLYKAAYLYSTPYEDRKARMGYRIVRTFGWFYWGRDILNK